MRIYVFLYLEYFSYEMETHSVFVDAVPVGAFLSWKSIIIILPMAFYRFHLSPLGLQNPKSKPEIYSLVFIISDFGWSCHASCGHHRLPLVVFPQVVGIILL